MSTFKRTPLVLEIEKELRISIPRYLRESYYKRGLSGPTIADLLGCSSASVYKWMAQLELTARMVAFKVMAEPWTGDQDLEVLKGGTHAAG